MASAEVIEALQAFRRKLWTPPPDLPPADWAAQNVYLDERQTEQPGFVQFHTRKFLVEVLNCVADKSVGEVTLVSGAQIGKSVTQMCALAYAVCCDPGPSLVVLPSRTLALSYVKSRWMPVIEKSEALQREIPPGRYAVTTLEQNFSSSVVAWVGAASPGNLSSRGVRYLLTDEVDKFPAETRREASALQLAEVRVRSYTFSKILRTSTPTLTSGPIWQHFLAGDQRYYWVPCPKCKQMQVLDWQHVRWDSFHLPDGSTTSPKSCRPSATSAHTASTG
jgi:phage terminase large subunit GpA-like protein